MLEGELETERAERVAAQERADGLEEQVRVGVVAAVRGERLVAAFVKRDEAEAEIREVAGG